MRMRMRTDAYDMINVFSQDVETICTRVFRCAVFTEILQRSKLSSNAATVMLGLMCDRAKAMNCKLQ